MKDCPKCKLVNPDTAERCDCGYDFASGTMQNSYLTDRDRRRKGGAVGAFVVFLLFLRFSGLVAGAKRGGAMFVWAVGLLVIFIAAVIYWPKFSSRDRSD
jgi:hypothetical protein